MYKELTIRTDFSQLHAICIWRSKGSL